MGEKCLPGARSCCARSPLPARWALAILGMAAFTFVYSVRINMSMAIVCMVNSTTSEEPASNVTMETPTPGGDDCGELEKNTAGYEGEFYWDNNLQGHILSSLFYGYMVTQIPGGWLADRFGGKHVYGCGMAIAIVATLLIPVCARASPYLVIAMRVIIGMGTGVTFPAINALWALWAPPLERSRLMTICNAGTMMGNILTLSLSGLLCSTNVDGGWPLVFYVFGGGAAIWYIFWLIFVYNSPSVHPCMKDEEREYIVSSLSHCAVKKEKPPVPWVSIMTSPALWAILVAHVCNNWGGYMLLTSLPKYMAQVLKYDIKTNGLLSAMPYMVQLVAAIAGGQLADFLRTRKILSTTATRRTLQVISFIGQGIFMVCTGFVSCSQRFLAVGLLAIAVGFTFGSRSGYLINHVDIAPRYAGVIFGITNTAASIPGIIAPIVVAELTPNGLREEWQKVFYITGGVFAFGAIVYGIFASGEEQKWAKDPDEENVLSDRTIEAKERASYDNRNLELDEGLKAGLQNHNTRSDGPTNQDTSLATKF